MSSTAEEHVIYKIANTPIRTYPYPHIYVENVFPEDFYAQLRANWPDPKAFTSLADTGRVYTGTYVERFVVPFKVPDIAKLSGDRRGFWNEFGNWFMADRFRETMIAKFHSYAQQRFGDGLKHCRFETDSLIVRDKTNFSIGPHSDAQHRLLSMLFYCPDDTSMSHLGTSIYVPLDPDFRCAGGPHYPHKKFRKVITMEYKPNSLFAFFKTDNSFHGVEPIKDEQVERDMLLYDVRVFDPRESKAANNTRSLSGFGLRMLARLFGSKKQ